MKAHVPIRLIRKGRRADGIVVGGVALHELAAVTSVSVSTNAGPSSDILHEVVVRFTTTDFAVEDLPEPHS